MIDELARRLIKSISSLTSDFEIIFIDDGSPDNAWEVIVKNASRDARVKGIKFSRNFGQHHAFTAGLDVCTGDWVVVMDSDLQDRPEEIPKLYTKAKEGYDVILARRMERQDGILKRLSNWIFYRIFNALTNMDYDSRVGVFRIISKRTVCQFRTMREQHRFLNGLIRWMGFSTATVDVLHGKRPDGKSSYTLRKLLGFALDIIVSYSERPLKVALFFGFLMALLSFLFGIVFLIKAFIYGSPITGWSSLIISIYFLGGITIMVLGMIGIYVGKTFSEVKKRPLYIVSQTTGFHEDRLLTGSF